jgi:hypothetical protein
MNGLYLMGRPNLDVVANHFAKALLSVKNVDGIELPRFSSTLITDLRDELRRVSKPPVEGAPAPAPPPRGYFGATELADVLDVVQDKREAFSTALSRARDTLPEDSWLEVQNKRPNAPTFLYRADCGEIRALAKKYQMDG